MKIQFIASDGFPVEIIKGKPIQGFLRKLIHTRKIKIIIKLFCNHKRIDICGSGSGGGKPSYTMFMCLKCCKQFKYGGKEIGVNTCGTKKNV